MLSKTGFGFIIFSVLSASNQVHARERWLERDNRPVFLHPRRFGQEQPAVLQKISAACPGQVCGNLAGQAVTPLLAAQPECSQQDLADSIIDASKQFDAATQANMIALAIEYRQVEKNTPPDFSTNPPALRNSVFCQKAPQNPELNGLVQAQDPANDPNLFFDPATQSTVQKGTQANTAPFGGAQALPAAASSSTVLPTAIREAVPTVSACVTAVTVTISATNPAATDTNAITVTISGTASTSATPAPSAAPPTTTGASGIGNFGSCTVPQIEFGVGFDNRKETSFEPVDKVSYNHGSAQNIGIIAQFICDTLTNSCGADQTAKDTCAKAQTAALAASKDTGAPADAFNAEFGITTNFSSIAAVDDQGKTVVVTTAAATASQASATSKSTIISTSTSAITSTSTTASNPPASNPPASNPPASSPPASSDSGVGNFGKCSVPQIEFGFGFDGRTEASFEPVDQTSYNHGSAQNIDIIAQFICGSLKTPCGADQTAEDNCAKAQSAASSATGGAQADAFNAVFGITTNFASTVNQDVDNGATSTTAAATTAEATSSSTTPAPAQKTAAPQDSNNLQSFSSQLGGVAPPAVTSLGNGKFQVEGNSVFNDQKSAILRSCDVQNNACANAANASGNKDGFTVASCTDQNKQCAAVANNV